MPLVVAAALATSTFMAPCLAVPALAEGRSVVVTQVLDTAGSCRRGVTGVSATYDEAHHLTVSGTYVDGNGTPVSGHVLATLQGADGNTVASLPLPVGTDGRFSIDCSDIDGANHSDDVTTIAFAGDGDASADVVAGAIQSARDERAHIEEEARRAAEERARTEAAAATAAAKSSARVSSRSATSGATSGTSGGSASSSGGWSAAKNYGTASANADGSMSEWADNYYIAHDWSNAGHAISSLDVGSKITVNGRTITITGTTEVSRDTTYEGLRSSIGSDVTAFQTCVPGGGYYIAYGK